MSATSSVGRIPKTAKDLYRGYIPPNLPQNRPPNKIKWWWKVEGRPRVTLYPKKEIEGYSEFAEYPPLNDGSRKGLKNQIRYDWYETIKGKSTVEEKLLEINRHQLHYMAHIPNWLPAYNSLPMAQYLTQTNLISKLPESYRISVDGDPDQDRLDAQLVKQMRQIILDQVAFDKYECPKKRNIGYVAKPIKQTSRNVYISNRFIQNLVSSIKRYLATQVNEQLLDYQCDLSPTIRSWWYHSGFEPPNNKIFYRNRKDDDGNINQMIQMDGFSSLNMRHDNFIEPIISRTDPIVTDLSLVQKLDSPLKFYGARFKFRWPVTLPGFWYNDERSHLLDCPHTCFLSTDCLQARRKISHNIANPLNDDENCLNGQAILTAYSWLNSLSMYHGYTPFQELDYPFTCQVVTTDGQNWLFNVYQLNNHVFHRDLGGPKSNNICWTSGLLRLFEEYKDGEFKGINDDVVKLIIRFFAQKTSSEYTSQLNLRPLLKADTRTEEERCKQEKRLRDTFEARIDKRAPHDWRVPLWEHIFFRSKENRDRITHMKPRWKRPKPKISRFFQ
ncbi:hypothetical protein SUGI_1515540 [Cryptomeria japonica]|uniref:28S ribosomal protein S30, mitochondrial n=1 Tax=Cryptomeria japonica TaxID=3369 RepID=A0AAD3NTT1_CRYJA|nr:hypothetical protein SUGI_1515540 [Cryptomeria japonica]